jgi:hypothetical protein
MSPYKWAIRAINSGNGYIYEANMKGKTQVVIDSHRRYRLWGLNDG